MILPQLSPFVVEEAVRAALAEDFGRAGDITSQATIPANAQAKALIAARKKPGVLAGLDLAVKAFAMVDPAIGVVALAQDGDSFAPGAVIARIEGSARGILAAERVALNFLGRLCGVSTMTAHYAKVIAHTKAKICCTRKTTPGLRAFEKYAVRCGGGVNHRFGLDDAVLIKDNHIAIAGGVVPALRAAKAFVGHLVKIEIEVDTLDQLREVLDQGGADAVLLDNMSPAQLREAVGMVGGRMTTEASGGISLDSLREVAETGVDLISSGALTHSAPVLDLGLDIEIG
jgi:nicotinate-nucleotide pyrophosphorylase (carboxylating)